MKIIILSFTLGIVVQAWASSTFDCHFDDKRAFCHWKREWFGMRRAGWRSGKKIRSSSLGDHTSGRGKFAYFLARSRPVGFRSRLRSPPAVPPEKSCFVFWLAMGGSGKPFPAGNSELRVYLINEGGSIEAATPIWIKSDSTPQDGQFHRVIISIDGTVHALNGVSVQLVIETIRGKSKKAFVAIDDISMESCATSDSQGLNNLNDVHEEASMKMKDVKKKLMRMMLPAKRSEIGVIDFQDLASGVLVAPPSDEEHTSAMLVYHSSSDFNELDRPLRLMTRKERIKKKKRLRRQRKQKKNKKTKKHKSKRKESKFGAVTLLEEPTHPEETIQLNPNNILPISNSHHLTPVTCDFIEYTQRLHRCFRSFFLSLQQQSKACRSTYGSLETCVQSAATSCVLPQDMDALRVEEIVVGTLRNNFKTEQVFCEEEGAFVYPEFAVEKLPIQCGDRYFIKLSECSASFSSMFHVQHGDPKLCREYYRANECQRHTTADECNFDTETMLLYGLNLQYQFAHNPFCVHLPFSSWWPLS